MKIKKLNLKDPQVRFTYSLRLKRFENQFTYPLGDKTFFIRHGFEGEYDYFSFFEQMGEVNYFVIEENNAIIGAGCAILRTINNEKLWYLCDFKVSKIHRGRKALEKMLVKYFVPFYFRAKKMIFVNMSHPDNNGLVKKVIKMFSWFKLELNEMYFFEWSKKELISSDFDLSEYFIIHNNHKKDIVIEGKPYPIYHLINKNHLKDYSKFQIIDIENIKDDDTIMLSSVFNTKIETLIKAKKPSTVGSIVTYGIKDEYFSSSEI